MATAVTQPTQTLPGLHAELELYSDRIVVRQNDLLSQVFQGTRTIAPKDIANIHLYESCFLNHGQIHIRLRDRTRAAITLDYKCEHHPIARAIIAAIEAQLLLTETHH
ncbi:MAG TPA: hypothetical protein VHO69_17090 [Phototrophicaceae bacterium]|nr:hypothetical protein [Phototrophicaceae bacterium]